jgi:hypothetical protein
MKTKEQIIKELDEKIISLEYHENEYDRALTGPDRVIHARKADQLSNEIKSLQSKLEAFNNVKSN